MGRILDAYNRMVRSDTTSIRDRPLYVGGHQPSKEGSRREPPGNGLPLDYSTSAFALVSAIRSEAARFPAGAEGDRYGAVFSASIGSWRSLLTHLATSPAFGFQTQAAQETGGDPEPLSKIGAARFSSHVASSPNVDPRPLPERIAAHVDTLRMNANVARSRGDEAHARTLEVQAEDIERRARAGDAPKDPVRPNLDTINPPGEGWPKYLRELVADTLPDSGTARMYLTIAAHIEVLEGALRSEPVKPVELNGGPIPAVLVHIQAMLSRMDKATGVYAPAHGFTATTGEWAAIADLVQEGLRSRRQAREVAELRAAPITLTPGDDGDDLRLIPPQLSLRDAIVDAVTLGAQSRRAGHDVLGFSSTFDAWTFVANELRAAREASANADWTTAPARGPNPGTQVGAGAYPPGARPLGGAEDFVQVLKGPPSGTPWTGPAILSRIRVMLQGEGASPDGLYDLVPMVAPVRAWRDLERLATAGMAASAEQRGEFEDSRPGIAFDRVDIPATDIRVQDIDGFHHVIRGWVLDPATAGVSDKPATAADIIAAPNAITEPSRRTIREDMEALLDTAADLGAEDSRSMMLIGPLSQWRELYAILDAHAQGLGARIVLRATDSLADAIAQYAATSAQQPADSRPDSMDFTGSPAQWTEVAQIIEAHRDRLAARAYAEANRDPGGWPLLSDIADDVELRKMLETTRARGHQQGYFEANKALADLYAKYDLIPEGAGPEELEREIRTQAVLVWQQDGNRIPGVGFALRIDSKTWEALPAETQNKVAGLAQVISLLTDPDKAAEEELELAAVACGTVSGMTEIAEHIRFRLMAAAAMIREHKTPKA